MKTRIVATVEVALGGHVRRRIMKKILIISALMCSLCSSLAYGENPLLSDAFWKTATVEDVDSAVASGADVNASDKRGVTALMRAARFTPNPEVIERLLKLGADASYKNMFGRTALDVAKQNKTLKGTQAYLILSREKPFFSEDFWETAVVEDVNSAVANGADVNAKDNMGMTALMYAAWNNANPAVIERLVKLGADASYKNRRGRTALDVAKQNKSPMGTKAYQILSDATDLAYRENPFFSEEFWKTATVEDVNSAVANGSDVTADMGSGWTALMLAARNNSPVDVIERLVKLGADVHARTVDGFTVLMMATEDKGNADAIERLVKLGADVHARDTLLGQTILMHAAQRSPNPEIIDLLVKLGADVNSRTEQGWTALMMARNPEVIERLVKLGADVDARDASLGRTALMVAAESNPDPDVVERLVKLGVDINARDKYQGRTALMWAARFTSNPEVIERLLKLGADVSYKNECGHTALILVQENKQLKGAKTKAYQMLKDAANKDK